jgi:hypothetical protein
VIHCLWISSRNKTDPKALLVKRKIPSNINKCKNWSSLALPLSQVRSKEDLIRQVIHHKWISSRNKADPKALLVK